MKGRRGGKGITYEEVEEGEKKALGRFRSNNIGFVPKIVRIVRQLLGGGDNRAFFFQVRMVG